MNFTDQNIIIGPNGSGKSNFLSIFKFLQEICTYGLEESISRNGGRYLPNALQREEPVFIKFTIKYPQKEKNSGVFWTVEEIEYRFAFTYIDNEIVVKSDRFHLSGKSKSSLPEFNGIEYTSQLWLNRELNKYESTTDYSEEFPPVGSTLSEKDFKDFQTNWKEELDRIDTFSQRYILLEYSNFSYILAFQDLLKKIGIYDFQTKIARSSNEYSSSNRLSSSGDNLIQVLRKILNKEKQRQRFLLLLHDLLPFIRDLKISGNTKLPTLNVMETFDNSTFDFPSELISDGSIHLIAMIIALYFEDNNVVILEEPEKYVHPGLLPFIVEMIADRSSQVQTIVSTHNPSMLSKYRLDQIILTHRRQSGETAIKKAESVEGLTSFVSDKVGIDHLFEKDLIQW